METIKQTPRGRRLRAGASQVDRACKAVLRAIWSDGLQPGDRIPNHRDFAQTTGLSNSSLVPAMRRLTEAGVIKRRPRSGSVVVDPAAYRDPLWRVGIVENFKELSIASPFYSLLGACVQNELARVGCLPKLYFRSALDAVPPETVEDYPELALDAKAGLLDGAICLGSFDKSSWNIVTTGARLCGFGESVGCGAVIDWAGFTRSAVRCLAEQGCRRISIVDNEYNMGRSIIREGLRAGLVDAGLSAEAEEDVYIRAKKSPVATGPKRYLMAGRVVARDLLEREPARRPEGLIVLDDIVAAGLMAVLREADGYRPRIAVLAHVQNPREYPLPVVLFELDIAELAQRGVAVLLERVLNPDLPDQIDRIPTRLASTEDADRLRTTEGMNS